MQDEEEQLLHQCSTGGNKGGVVMRAKGLADSGRNATGVAGVKGALHEVGSGRVSVGQKRKGGRSLGVGGGNDLYGAPTSPKHKRRRDARATVAARRKEARRTFHWG